MIRIPCTKGTDLVTPVVPSAAGQGQVIRPLVIEYCALNGIPLLLLLLPSPSTTPFATSDIAMRNDLSVVKRDECCARQTSSD